ncbi:unnamed protein product [Cuscuta epithymum]|uniref:Protein TIFY n=1 Tax=Cuscuta epithymum TaxID=186058 RepID=A0AAV0FSD9_9ASTE|nr:unnamed protein product [Cuscuta epithymum]CAH9138296.1 unnamed protein product [Cuscuta epithymum]
MAHPNSNANSKLSAEELKGNTIYHDFLGKGCAPDFSPAASSSVRPPFLEPYPVASCASLGVFSGGGCGPVSTASDMCSGPQSSYAAFSGSKRCSSDSNMVSCKDRFPAIQPDSLASSHVMKLLRSGAGGEKCRASSHNEEPSLRGHDPMRPFSSSPSMGATRTYSTTSTSKWVPLNPLTALKYPPHTTQVVPFGYQTPPNRFSRDTNTASRLLISQAAADEGSRTGIKGSGVLRMSDRTLSEVPLSVTKQNSGIRTSDPAESPNPGYRVGPTGHQMTIFYNGQAHVFDDVHPSKADLIMALAGSNGGSWSTTYGLKSVLTRGMSDTADMGSGSMSMAAAAILGDLQGRSSSSPSSLPLDSSRPFDESSFIPPGNHLGGEKPR